MKWEWKCVCPQPEPGVEFHCEKLNRTMTRRRWELCCCVGPSLTPAMCKKYINHWLNGKPSQVSAITVPHRTASVKAVQNGPGSIMKKLMTELGFRACNRCNALASQMDEWGIAGCLEHKEVILTQLREHAKRVGWWEKCKAGVIAIKNGVFINPLDPASSIFDESMRRAAEKT